MIFFFKDTATTEIYTLSLHDALPISAKATPNVGASPNSAAPSPIVAPPSAIVRRGPSVSARLRSEEHTSELQSQSNLVCRLLLDKKHTDQLHIEQLYDADASACLLSD